MQRREESQRSDHDEIQEELDAALETRDAYHSLLQELPDVFEHKFRERVRPVLDRNRQLIAEGQELREQIHRALPPATQSPRPSSDPQPGVTRDPPQERHQPVGPMDRLRAPLVGGAVIGGMGLILIAALMPRVEGPSPQRSKSATTPPANATQRQLPPQGVERAKTTPESSKAGPPRAGGSRKSAGRGELVLMARGTSWVYVVSNEEKTLFQGLLDGELRLPLGKGVKIRSGRPDLLTVETEGTSPRILGSIDALQWHTIPSPSRPASGPG